MQSASFARRSDMGGARLQRAFSLWTLAMKSDPSVCQVHTASCPSEGPSMLEDVASVPSLRCGCHPDACFSGDVDVAIEQK